MRRLASALAAAGLVASTVFAGASASAVSLPAPDAASVRLAGGVTPAAPDPNAATPPVITIPVTVTNTSSAPLYDVTVSSLRSAPITERSALTAAFTGTAVEPSDSTNRGPRVPLTDTLAPGESRRLDYRVDATNENTGICLCFLGVYALDVVVSAADEPGGETATVARTQTYLPSLLEVEPQNELRVGWLWPLLDRPHRLGSGSEFADDDLAASVAPGGRLDRALAVLQSLDAADARQPGLARSVTLLLDPELIDELVAMRSDYTVRAADGTVTNHGPDASAETWLQRLADVIPQHDVRMTAPSDPDLVGLAARGVPAQVTPDAATTARVTSALGLPADALPRHDLAWPVEAALDAAAVKALGAAGATSVVTTGDTDDDGAVATVATATGGAKTTPVLLDDPTLASEAADAIGLGRDTTNALQKLVVSTAMTSVQHPDDSRFVLLVPDRAVDVAPAAAVRAIESVASLGVPTSPLVALGDAATSTTRADLLSARPPTAPAPLGAALAAAADATTAAATIRATVVSGADGVIGDLPVLAQQAVANGWVEQDAPAGRWQAAVTSRTTALRGAVQVVAPATGGYSLASADAPLLLTVSNDLPVDVRIRVNVGAVGRSNGFSARTTETTVAAGSRQTIQVPTSVTRSGRFEVAVTLRTTGGVAIGSPARITVTSTAVGAVGQIVTYGAGALLVLALLVRGVRRLITRSRAGSGGTGPDGDTPRPDGRPGGQPTVPATHS